MIGSSASRIGDIVLTPSGDLVLMTVPAHPYDRVWILSDLTSISVFVYPTDFSFRSLGGFRDYSGQCHRNCLLPSVTALATYYISESSSGTLVLES